MDNKMTSDRGADDPVGAEQVDLGVSAESLEVSKDAKNMATLCHILGLVGFPGPLLVWLLTKDRDKFIDDNGKEAVNYQLSMLIYFFAAWVLCLVLIGFFLIPALIVLNTILVILGAVKASDGQSYRYPIAIRFIK